MDPMFRKSPDPKPIKSLNKIIDNNMKSLNFIQLKQNKNFYLWLLNFHCFVVIDIVF